MKASAVQVLYTQSDARAQRELGVNPFQRRSLPNGTLWTEFYRYDGRYVLRFPGLADFLISADGREIAGHPAPDTDAGTMEHLYLNQILPLALSRQGKLVLHASAVKAGDGCVAFLGDSGRGKSTLAASFAAAGTPFLTDDGLQIDWARGRMVAVPSHPSIRLWEDSQRALIDRPNAGPGAAYTSKIRLLAGPELAHCPQPRPLRAMYFLGQRMTDAVDIEPLHPAAAVLELVRHSFLLDVSEREQLTLHFEEISRIANARLHYHLDYPRRYEALAQVRDAVLRHLHEHKDS